MTHACHAIDCPKVVPPRMLFCGKHWRMLSKNAQAVIWREYRPGQERDKNPSARYLVAQAMVVAYVAGKDGKMSKDEIAEFIIARVKAVGMDGSEAVELLADMGEGRGRSTAPATSST